jgi:hypothetical protein
MSKLNNDKLASELVLQLRSLTEDGRRYVLGVLEVHLRACARQDVEPTVQRTVVEALDDWRHERIEIPSPASSLPGISPYEPARRYSQYASPRADL